MHHILHYCSNSFFYIILSLLNIENIVYTLASIQEDSIPLHNNSVHNVYIAIVKISPARVHSNSEYYTASFYSLFALNTHIMAIINFYSLQVCIIFYSSYQSQLLYLDHMSLCMAANFSSNWNTQFTPHIQLSSFRKWS